MKYIKKNEEPTSLNTWRQDLVSENKTFIWRRFNKSVKNEVFDSLLKEQGYICCYCERGISRDKCHIEHLKPKSIETYKHLMFDYTNMMISCETESEEPPPQPLHCGHKKDNWYDESLMVSPLDAACESFFKYSGSGDILPTNEPNKQIAAETTIDKLGLNIPKLTRMRREAIDGILQAIQGLTNEEIQQLAQGFEQPDAAGKYLPFCSAIAYTLKQYFVP